MGKPGTIFATVEAPQPPTPEVLAAASRLERVYPVYCGGSRGRRLCRLTPRLSGLSSARA